MTQLVFARQSAGTPEDPAFTSERLVNLHIRPGDGTSGALIKQTYGLTEWADTGAGAPVRAMLSAAAALYVVAGGALYSVSATGVVLNIGAVKDAIETTLFENDNGEIGIAAGGDYYVLSDGALSRPAVNAVTVVQSATYLDGYGVLADGVTDRLQVTSLNAAATLDPLQFASADSLPDGIVSVLGYASFLWVFGRQSTEIWRFTGNRDFPFQRMSGATIPRGCFAAMSVAADDQAVFFVGDDRRVYRIVGTNAEPISTPAVSRVLEGVSSGDGIVGLTWTEGGAKFYGVRFPEGPTWVFDQTTGAWAERSAGVLGSEPWSGVSAARFGGRELIGAADGKIYFLSPDAFLEAGANVARIARAKPIVRGDRRSKLARVSLNLRTGAVGMGRDARVGLRVSRNGLEWSPIKWRSMGGTGRYGDAISWYGLGQARQHQLEMVITDPIPVSLYGGTFTLA